MTFTEMPTLFLDRRRIHLDDISGRTLLREKPL
jgi:hypothetical protein